jgi:hypothetical protein
MTLLSENNKKEISVREIKKNQHYYPRDTNMTLLSEKYTYDITVQEIQKRHYCPRTTEMTLLSAKKNSITVREIQK